MVSAIHEAFYECFGAVAYLNATGVLYSKPVASSMPILAPVAGL